MYQIICCARRVVCNKNYHDESFEIISIGVSYSESIKNFFVIWEVNMTIISQL